MNSNRKKYKNIIRASANSDTKDRIWAYYLDNDSVTLTAKEEDIRQRWSACFSLLTQYHSVQQAVSVMVKQYDISEAQAYRDVRSALELFGDVTKSNREAYRHILFEFAMKIFQLAATKNDLVEMNKALQSMIKIKGIDKEESAVPDFSQLQPNIYEITLPTEHLHLIQQISQQGIINIDYDESDQEDNPV